nr:odorant receptor 47 [Podabrus annulatus]
MTHFNAEAILAHSKMIYQLFGLWPEVNSSAFYNIRGLVIILTAIVGAVLMYTKAVLDFIEGEYENGSYVMCLALIVTHVVYKVWCLLTNKPLFFEILTNLEDPALLYHHDNFDIYLLAKIQSSKTLFNMMVILCGFTSTIIIVAEYFFGMEGDLVFVPFNISTKHLIPYISTWILSITTSFIAGFIVGIFEGLLLIFLSLGIAQLQILQKEIIHSVDFYASDTNLNTKEEILYYDKMVNTELKKCVERHNAIERFISSIEAKYSTEFLVQLCITLGVTAFLGLNIILASGSSIDSFKCASIFLADVIPVFLIYYHCNEITLQSEMIRDACYMSSWIACGSSVRKTLYIIMERSKRPFYLTTGKFSNISLDLFVTFLKTSMSYYTVLKSLVADDL